MLFAGTYTLRQNVTEETTKRSLDLFTNWTPPAGFAFKSHYSFSDGTGGLFVADATAETLLEATTPWAPFFAFTVWPVVDITAAVPVFQKVYAWRDSVR